MARDDELLALLDRLPGRQVVVVGDVMLDEYLTGAVLRVSPEAPVPVLQLESRTDSAGGAGNAAVNIAGLGGVVALGGLVGEDEGGRRLRAALEGQGVCFSGAITEDGRPTTTKSRLVAGQQQIARVDVEDTAAIGPDAADRLLAWFADACASSDAVLLCDYHKGALPGAVCQRIIQHARARRLPVVVDPKGAEYGKYRGSTVITPNEVEAEAATRHHRPLPPTPESCAAALVAELDGTAVLLTRGPAGMTLFASGDEPISVPADVQRVYDVTGAGDTVAAVLALALATGAALPDAMRLANRAAGVVVARPGTTAVQADQLRHALSAAG